MAWIYQCVLCISLFQAAVHAHGPTLQRNERSANAKTNGSYKIVNRYGKPFVNKRVPDDSVVFPGPTFRSGDDIALQIPEECKRIGICEEAPPFQDDLVENVIRDYQRRNVTFNKDVLEGPQIAERIGPDVDNVELCTSQERLIFPKLAKDTDERWHRIVNTDDVAAQSVRIEVCTGGWMTPCSEIAIFQDGYSARCVQKYIYRNMVAVTSDGEVVTKAFPTPSCCSCVAKTV